MDPEGAWNPPELWPESSPPLPGWVRGADGRWSAPSEIQILPDPTKPIEGAPAVIDLTTRETAVRPAKELPPKHAIKVPKTITPPKQTLSEAATSRPPSLRLGFAESQETENTTYVPQDNRKGVLLVLAFGIAAVIAGLVVVLLVL